MQKPDKMTISVEDEIINELTNPKDDGTAFIFLQIVYSIFNKLWYVWC